VEKKRPATNESAKPKTQTLAEEKSLQRAQKRLATQSERDKMAELSPAQAADSQLDTEHAVEGQ
jgi:hypothetical protein